jgi:hypothetical protein
MQFFWGGFLDGLLEISELKNMLDDFWENFTKKFFTLRNLANFLHSRQLYTLQEDEKIPAIPCKQQRRSQ